MASTRTPIEYLLVGDRDDILKLILPIIKYGKFGKQLKEKDSTWEVITGQSALELAEYLCPLWSKNVYPSNSPILRR